MIRLSLIVLGTFLMALSLPGTFELLMLSIAGVLPSRRKLGPQQHRTFRLAVVVPAHNEQLHVARCVESLLAMSRDGVAVEVIVVADNCEDLTADAAAAAGARVLVRQNIKERGKGYALDYAFRALEPECWDAYAVVDADSEVLPNFATELTAALQSGADAVQCRYLVRNADESARTRLMSVALSAYNVLRPLGRDRLGVSAGIYGNGFALSAETLRAVPYSAASLVEDLEYHLALLRAGKKVRFQSSTTVYGDMPTGGAGVKTQRTRWEGGRFRMLIERAPGLTGEILRGNFSLVEPLLDLLLLPLAFHVALLLAVLLTPFPPIQVAALIGLSVVALHLTAAIRVTGGGLPEFTALLGTPFYIVWKILLIPRLVKSSRAGTAWVRTERAAQKDIP